jgi:hypothetical protein
LQIKVEPEVQALFDASITVHVGNGEKTMFWMDKWLDGQSIADLAPSLVPLVAKRIMRSRAVCQALTASLWVRDISGALSVAALVDYLHLWQRL